MPRLNKFQLAKIKKELAKDGFILAKNSGNKCYFEKRVTEDYVLCLDLIYRVDQIDFWFHVHLPIFDPERMAYLIDLSYNYGLLGDFIKKNDNLFYKFKTLDIDLIEKWLIIAKNYLIKDFGTIQLCLETYDSNKYPDYTFNRELSWIHFGFLNAIYGNKKRAVELFQEFVNTDFSHEYMGEKRHSKCDVIRQKYAKMALENIDDKDKILELIREMNAELEKV